MYSMFLRLGLLFSCLVGVLHANAAIEAVVQHTVFYKPGKSKGSFTPFTEVCWQVNPNTIQYRSTAEKLIVGEIKADVLLYKGGVVVGEDHFIMQTPGRKNVEALASLSIMEQRKFDVPAGVIKVRVILVDVQEATNKFVYTDSFEVAEAPQNAFYSDLQLVDTVVASQAASSLQRDGLLKVPIATNFIDEYISRLHYYTELYLPEGTTGKLVHKVGLSKRQDELPSGKLLKVDTVDATERLLHIYGMIPIESVGSGNYYLNAVTTNLKGEKIAGNSLFLQRLNKHPVIEEKVKQEALQAANDTGLERVTVLDLSKTFLAKYTTVQLKAILKMILPNADANSQNTIHGFLKKPDDLYMRYFVYNYFQAINKDDPGKAWKEYSDNIVKVNKRFTENGVAGYETDRGKTFIKYGEPTEIIKVTNENGALPYEVWQYNLLLQKNSKTQNNAIFLFYKPNRPMPAYELLHSNVTGEINNTGWRSFLYISAQGGNNGNSMAEQYIGNR